ncbi:MAG: DUF4124 domain-containing protein [Ignavibacteriales bacterium]
MHRMVLAFLIAVSFLMLKVALAQTMGGGTEATSPTSQTPSQGTQMPPQGTATQPGQVVNPLYPPYFPPQNLDNFGLSTIGNKGIGENKGGSTLGVGTKQKTNAEVNKPKEKKETEGTAAQGGTESGTETNTTAAGMEETTQINSNQPTESLSTSLNKSSGLYTWKDKNGVVHVTNNIGSIPAEYQEQTINRAENGKNKEVSEPPHEGEQQ